MSKIDILTYKARNTIDLAFLIGPLIATTLVIDDFPTIVDYSSLITEI